MAELSWGKPTIKIGKIQANGNAPSSWIEIPTPVENSTKLTPTKGSKVEAKLEGGDNEAVRYGKNTFLFEFEIRAAKGRKKPVEDNDGVIEGEYSLKLQPENPAVEGVVIERGTLSMEPTFDTENGTKWKYTLDVLKPKSGNSVKFEAVDFSNAGSLKVVISGDGGAGEWRLSTEGENDWHKSGVTLSTKVGQATIVYKNVSGKTSPSQTSATVKKGELVEVNATYTGG